MTEQEIVSILKENKTKGIAYLFMPEEVSAWVSEHLAEPKLLYLNPRGDWEGVDVRYLDDYDNAIFALPDNFQIKKETVGEWVEFDIDENGCYRILDTDMRFHWSEWNKPLWIYEKDESRSWYFTAFGGWQYPNSDTWSMSSQVQIGRGAQNYLGYYSTELEDDARPAIPIKIRFWRESRWVR